MPASTPADRSAIARQAALTRWSREDPRPALAEVRKGFDARFEDEVDPERVLPPAERARRVEAARRAYFTRLALKSAKSRRKKAADRKARPKPKPVPREAPPPPPAHDTRVLGSCPSGHTLTKDLVERWLVYDRPQTCRDCRTDLAILARLLRKAKVDAVDLHLRYW